MIRHSSSFFISLIFHMFLFSSLFYAYKYLPIFKDKEPEKKVCVKLSCIVESKVPLKQEVIPVPKKPKPIKKIIKKELKKILPKKVIVKKEKILTVPIIKKIILPKEEMPQIIEKPKEVVQKIVKNEQVETLQEEKIIVDNYEPTEQKSIQEEYMDNHIQEIVKLLSNNLYYPRRARKRGITGEVVVKFQLSTQAKVTFSKVIQSKNEILSRAAIKTIEDLSGKFPKPSEELILEVPISYYLK